MGRMHFFTFSAIKPAEQHNPSSCFVIDSGKVYAKEVTSTKRNLYMIAIICVNYISSDLLMGGKKPFPPKANLMSHLRL